MSRLGISITESINNELKEIKSFSDKIDFINKLCLTINMKLGKEYKHIGSNLRINMINQLNVTDQLYYISLKEPKIVNNMSEIVNSFIAIDDNYHGNVKTMKLFTSQIDDVQFGLKDLQTNQMIKEPWFDLYEPCINIKLFEYVIGDTTTLELELIYINLINELEDGDLFENKSIDQDMIL